MYQSDISDVFMKCLYAIVYNVRFLILSNNIFVGGTGSRGNSHSNSKSFHSNGSSGNSQVLVIICWFPVETVNVTSVSIYFNNCNGSIRLNLNNNVTEGEILNYDCIHKSLICLSIHDVLIAH